MSEYNNSGLLFTPSEISVNNYLDIGEAFGVEWADIDLESHNRSDLYEQIDSKNRIT